MNPNPIGKVLHKEVNCVSHASLADTSQNPRFSPPSSPHHQHHDGVSEIQGRHGSHKLSCSERRATISYLQISSYHIKSNLGHLPQVKKQEKGGGEKKHKKSMRFLLSNLSLRKKPLKSEVPHGLLIARGLKFMQSTATLGSPGELLVTQKFASLSNT